MLVGLRARLSYANVVATLALFIALGGSSYAALSITTKDVKNRSLKGGDLRKNTITGTEIRESRLGRVPSATNAASADIAKSADSATTAGSAGTANVAGIAQDAQALAGQGAGAFERSSRVTFGRAAADPASSSAEQVVLSWPELGVALTTTDQGPCGGDLGVSFRNTRSSGPSVQVFQDGAGGAADPTVAPAGEANVCTASDPESFDATVTDSTGRALFVDCIKGNDELRCLGVRSEP
jgi:hypothetical protein